MLIASKKHLIKYYITTTLLTCKVHTTMLFLTLIQGSLPTKLLRVKRPLEQLKRMQMVSRLNKRETKQMLILITMIYHSHSVPCVSTMKPCQNVPAWCLPPMPT